MTHPFTKSSMPTYLINRFSCTTRWLRCFPNIVIPLKSLSLVLITKSQPSRNPSSPLIQRIMVTLSMKRRVPLLLARDLGSLIPATPHSHHQFVLCCSLFFLRKISRSSGCLPHGFRVPGLLFHMEHTFLSSPPASPLPSPSRNQCRAERRNKTAI